MAYDQNSHLSPTKYLQTDTWPILKSIKSNNSKLSTSAIILMNSDSNPSISSTHSAKKKCLADDYSKLHCSSTRKQTVVKELPVGYLRHRLCVRQFYVTRL